VVFQLAQHQLAAQARQAEVSAAHAEVSAAQAQALAPVPWAGFGTLHRPVAGREEVEQDPLWVPPWLQLQVALIALIVLVQVACRSRDRPRPN